MRKRDKFISGVGWSGEDVFQLIPGDKPPHRHDEKCPEEYPPARAHDPPTPMPWRAVVWRPFLAGVGPHHGGGFAAIRRGGRWFRHDVPHVVVPGCFTAAAPIAAGAWIRRKQLACAGAAFFEQAASRRAQQSRAHKTCTAPVDTGYRAGFGAPGASTRAHRGVLD